MRTLSSSKSSAALPISLDHATLAEGVRQLTKRHPPFARIVAAYGTPPLWARRPGFATLVHIILEQQVSIASAWATYLKLRRAIAPITPRRFLTLDDVTLKRIGFSRQKTAYVRYLAQAMVEHRFSHRPLAQMPDDDVRAALVAHKGIGNWSADIYLLMVLRRPDICPSGDLALQVAAQRLFQLPARPTPDELTGLAEAWRPWRAVATRLLWHYYLNERRGRPLPPHEVVP